MAQQIWLAAAAASAILVSVFWYARREERVRGRAVAAALRMVSLFLILGGLFLPSFGRGGEAGPQRVALLDTSRSMTLPASAMTGRLDSALRVMRGFSPDLVIGFGANAEQLPLETIADVEADDGATRIASALETARRLGADSVLVISDGEWDDRREAIAAAERLGIAVREVNVASPTGRIGLVGVNAPRQMRAGDTTRLAVELFSSGPNLPDSVTVEVLVNGRPITTRRLETPASGRSSRMTLAVVPAPPAGDSEWRRYEVALDAAADPYGVSARRGIWTEVTRRATGAVLVALTADWEARYLLPVVRRASTAGAVGYLLAAPGRFVRIGPNPTPVELRTVVRDAGDADLLVILGAADRLAPELRSAAERQQRLLLIPGGSGAAVGTPVRLADGQAGDWYLEADVSASPISRLLAGLAIDDVPPLTALFEAEGPSAWAPLRARRDRQGPARPVLSAGVRAQRRWVIAAGVGYWRWSFREGGPRQLYDRMFTGAVGWLLENRVARVVQLDSDPPPAGQPLTLQVAAGVERLEVSIRDSLGAVVWRDTSSLGPAVTGPALEPGSYELEASGRRGDSRFSTRRPFDAVEGSRELVPRARAPELLLAGTNARSSAGDSPGRRPVWPFVVAALLLCVEWMWRRRIGLR
jgi:hypothetical protein